MSTNKSGNNPTHAAHAAKAFSSKRQIDHASHAKAAFGAARKPAGGAVKGKYK